MFIDNETNKSNIELKENNNYMNSNIFNIA